jgi:hypothetical protein
MLKQLAVFVVAVALAVVSASDEEEGTISFSFSSPCTFTGSWYFEGDSVDTESTITQFGAGSLKVWQRKESCYARVQLVTPTVRFCDASVLADKEANWMHFVNFNQQAIYDIYVYLTAKDRIAVEAYYDCSDTAFSGSSVPGMQASSILDVCSNSQNNDFRCFDGRRRRQVWNSTSAL